MLYVRIGSSRRQGFKYVFKCYGCVLERSVVRQVQSTPSLHKVMFGAANIGSGVPLPVTIWLTAAAAAAALGFLRKRQWSAVKETYGADRPF